MDPRILRIHFTNPEKTQQIHLDFQLLSNHFVNKWLELLKNAITAKAPIRDEGVYYGPALNDRHFLLSELHRTLKILNEYQNGPHIHLQPYLEMSQNFLDDLHKEFERLGALFYQDEKLPAVIDKALIDLNASIHKYEVFTYKNVVLDSPEFAFDVNFQCADKIPLADEDYSYFTADRNWGDLSLNYATIGVPPLDAFLRREIKMPVPQTAFKSDFTVRFERDFTFKQWAEMDQWAKDKFGLNIHDAKFSVGTIPLGKYLPTGLNQTQVMEAVRSHRRIAAVEVVGG